MRWLHHIYSPPLFVAMSFVLVLFSSPPSSEASIRLCGQRLTTTLLAVCRNQLCGGMGSFKRSISDSTPWIPATQELFQLHHQQKRGGIATECCEKRCSFAYLKTYCCNDDEEDEDDDDLNSDNDGTNINNNNSKDQFN